MSSSDCPAAVAEILPAFPGEETPEKKDEKK